jgi:hypothetical protein
MLIIYRSCEAYKEPSLCFKGEHFTGSELATDLKKRPQRPVVLKTKLRFRADKARPKLARLCKI